MFGAESLEDFIHKSVAKKSLARISEAPSEEEDMMSSIIESFRRKIQSVENVDIKQIIPPDGAGYHLIEEESQNLELDLGDLANIEEEAKIQSQEEPVVIIDGDAEQVQNDDPLVVMAALYRNELFELDDQG